MDRTIDAAIALLAASQHGVFTRSQARKTGASEAFIQHRLRTGRWVALSREAIIIAGVPPSFERDLMAATLSIPGATASHESAAQLWRMIGVPRNRLVVTIPKGGNHRLRVARVCESNDLKRRDLTRVDQIRVTSRERTICDAGRFLGIDRLARMVDHQLNLGAVDLPGIYGTFYRYARRGRRGTAKLRVVLEQREPGFVAPESELEHRTLELIRAAGLPEPDRQVLLTFWESLMGRVDFVYVDAHLIVEVDGRRFHGPETFQSDRERDNAAKLVGWDVLHFTWAHVTQRPDYVVGSIREALRLAAARAESSTVGTARA
jgi:Protein of unknown function (DUF559)